MPPQVRGLAIALAALFAFGLLASYWAELRWVRYALAVAAVTGAVWTIKRMRTEGIRLDNASLGRCVTCGYDLEGHDPPGKCPECGEPFGASR